MPYRILVADDEPDVRALLRDALTMQGYLVSCAGDGGAALAAAGRRPDLILLDIGMPGPDGMEVCRRIRDYVDCPILFLTARIEDSDKLKAFAVGGDDYITKPFSLDELSARVAAHLRRQERILQSGGHGARVLFAGDLAVDYAACAVTLGGQAVPLAKKEWEILAFLSQNPGQVFDKERIYEALWGYDGEGSANVVAEHIKRLRKKLGAAGAHIQTVWGLGYKWVSSL